MPVETTEILISTRGNDSIEDLTPRIEEILSLSKLRSGLVHVFVPGSTAAVTTVEYEPGLVEDLTEAVRRWSPREMAYRHNRIDDNGHSHIRAALLGPSLTIPFSEHRLLLGTWQQAVLIDSDVRPRRRKVIIQLIGE